MNTYSFFPIPKKRKADAYDEVLNFIKVEQQKRENTFSYLILSLSEYHNNIQSFGLRNFLLLHFPQLIILEDIKQDSLIILNINIELLLGSQNHSIVKKVQSLINKNYK